MNQTENIEMEMKQLKNEVKLSEQSERFIENLRIYLFSSGKNSDEIEEIIEELESHLSEAEKRGKSIEKIIGKSPKEYMEMISNEMVIDYRTWFKYILLILIGAFSITIIRDVLEGALSYSLLEIIGYLVITVIFIFSVLKGFKYISTIKQSIGKQIGILIPIVMVPGALFFGLIFLNRAVDTPIIQFSNTASMVIGIITMLFIIGMSIWAKTWILIVVVAFISLPGYVLNQTSLPYETQLILESIIMFGGVGIYLLISTKIEQKKTSRETSIQ